MKIKEKKTLLEQLDALKIFPNNKLVRQLRKQIKNALEKLERKEKVPEPKIDKNVLANQTRRSKLRKYHNYIRKIRNNFPNLSYHQIRSQFSKRKQGKEVSIPDVIWQNPSP